MPTVIENVKESMWNYPSLYGDDQYSIWRVLNHLYLVLGNGYEWVNGEIVELIFPGENDDLPRTLDEHNRKVGEWYFGRKLGRSVSRLYGGDPEYPVRFYPLSEYSKIATMPQNVTDDYLLWGIRLLRFAEQSPPEWYLFVNLEGQPTAQDQKLRLVRFGQEFMEKWKDRILWLREE